MFVFLARSLWFVPLVLCHFICIDLIYGSLTALPRARNVQSAMLMFDDHLGDVGGLFHIKEYIDQDRGSVRVDVRDESESDSSQEKKTSFFRLEQDGNTNSELVCYNHEAGLCSEATTATWPLKDFSRLLENLYATDESVLKTAPTQAEASLVGPNALLQIIYDNADKFVYDVMGFDDVHLTNTYYFSMRPFDFGFEDEVKLIVMVQWDHININAHNDKDNMSEFNTKIKAKITKLSELNMLGHLSGVVLVSDTKRHSASEYLTMSSALLVNFALLRPPRLAMFLTFHLIEPRSHRQHLGVSETSPFLLPAGVGCGELASRHKPLFVLARQFSGQFSARDRPNDYFAAYDEMSNHFRYDSLGEHKMIFALNEHLATLIQLERSDGGHGDSVHQSNRSTDEAAVDQNRAHENSHHCAQTSLFDEQSLQHQTLSVSSLSDFLGLGGNRAGLMYLGYDHLLNCHMYEREIIFSQIPLLSKLHLRLVPAASAKFTLVFYFINELDSLTTNNAFARQVHAYESMWLKRMDLVSLMSFSKYTLTNSRLDFTRSSWSLAQVSETSHERRFELLHPTRMFDTLECWPARGQTQLDFVMKRAKTIGHAMANDTTKRARDQNWVSLTETLEESLMQFLTQQINFPRSEVCDFELVLPDEGDEGDEQSALKADSGQDRRLPQTMLIRSKLVRPLEYTFEKFRVGWLLSIVPALKLTHQAEVFEHSYLMNVHECLLSLATRLAGANAFYMLYCPGVGCARLLGDDPLRAKDKTNGTGGGGLADDADSSKLDYVSVQEVNAGKSQQAPSVSSYPEMCEIYRVTKRFSTEGLVAERFRGQILREKLEQSKMVLEVYELNESSEFSTQLHQAIVSEVSLVNGLDLNLRDDQLLAGVCFTLDTEFKLSESRGPGRGGDGTKLEIKLIELNFDAHHSRVHCHKACLMQEFCQTYSYSRKRRVCHLSSASRRLIQDPSFTMTRASDSTLPTSSIATPADCTVHALNHLSLYKRRPLVVYDTFPNLVLDTTKKLLICSLDQCANLCRLNELRRTAKGGKNADLELSRSNGCQHFGYIRMRTLCVVEREVEIVEELVGSQVNVSKSDLNFIEYHMEPREMYQRDFLQDYAVKYNTAIVMEQPAAEPAPEVVGRIQHSPAMTLIRDLNEFECSRECSILSKDCVAFDWCSQTESHRHQEVCHLYRVRSPLTVARAPSASNLVSIEGVESDWVHLPESSTFVSKLNELEIKFYVANRSNEHKLRFESRQSCKHFYLEADNLYLKRALSVARANYQLKDEPIENTLPDRGASTDWRLSSEESSQPNLSNVKLMSLQAFAGLLVGFVLFLLQPALVQLVSSSQLVERLRSGGGSLLERAPVKGRERSMSRVEITEMMELGDEEEDNQIQGASTSQDSEHNNNN